MIKQIPDLFFADHLLSPEHLTALQRHIEESAKKNPDPILGRIEHIQRDAECIIGPKEFFKVNILYENNRDRLINPIMELLFKKGPRNRI